MNRLRRPTRQNGCHHRARGFWLIELLVVLGVLGAIALAGGRMFESTIRLGQANAQSANDAASFDAMTSALRSDAWSAAEMVVGDGGASVTLTRGGGTGGDAATKTTWTIKDGLITRGEAGGGANVGGSTAPRSWPIGAGATFAADGASLTLRVPANESFAGGEVRVVSQVKLIAGRPA